MSDVRCQMSEINLTSDLCHLTSDGAIAQLGERLNGIQEVGGSTPPGSTK
jgi:hypothetical protein